MWKRGRKEFNCIYWFTARKHNAHNKYWILLFPFLQWIFHFQGCPKPNVNISIKFSLYSWKIVNKHYGYCWGYVHSVPKTGSGRGRRGGGIETVINIIMEITTFQKRRIKKSGLWYALTYDYTISHISLYFRRTNVSFERINIINVLFGL